MEAASAAAAFSVANDTYGVAGGLSLHELLGSIAPILGTVGSVLSVIQYLSCIPTFVEVSRRKSTGKLSAMPYCTTSLLSLLWVTYALMVWRRDSRFCDEFLSILGTWEDGNTEHQCGSFGFHGRLYGCKIQQQCLGCGDVGIY